MDVQQVRYFVMLAEELHFGHAAERLHITPSPLSRRIKELERELHGELFRRTHHRVELTDFGREFLEPARDVLQQFDALKRLARGPGSGARRQFQVGATPLSPPQALDTVVETIEAVRPYLDLPLTLEPSVDLLTKLETCQLDLAVVHLPIDEPELDSLALARYTFGIAMRADDVLAGLDRVTLRQLRDRELLFGSDRVQPAAMAKFRQFLEDAGVRHIRRLQHNDVVQMASIVARSRSLTLTLLNEHMPGRRVWDDERFQIVPLDEPGLAFQVGVAWRRAQVEEDADLHRIVAALKDGPGASPAVY